VEPLGQGKPHSFIRVMTKFVVAILLTYSGMAISGMNDKRKCVYSDEMVVSKVSNGGKIEHYDAKRAPAKQGDERVLTEHLTLANSDDVSIVQSYCYVYRYDLRYRLSGEKTLTSLVDVLPVFDDLIYKSYAHDYLTRPLSEIVLDSLSMQQKMLKMPFSQGLPNRYTSTSEFVEYFIEYNPLEEDEKFSAEFRVHIDVGGLD